MITGSRIAPVINFTRESWTANRAQSLTVKYLCVTVLNKRTRTRLTRTCCFRPTRVDTKPQLEIFADDVKCTHGAAVGQIDEEERFYLESRGINPTLARNMLTYGFAEEVIEKIGVESIRRELDEAVLNRLQILLQA